MPKNYDYIKGLAELSLELGRIAVNVRIQDYSKARTKCDYCGAILRYKFYFSSPKKAEIGIGCECAGKLSEYLGMHPEDVKKAISFFDYYRDLCKKVNIEPEAIVGLKELEAKIKDLKAKQSATRNQRHLEGELRAQENREKIMLLKAKWEVLNDWEKDFFQSCETFMSPRMEEVLNKIVNEKSQVPSEEANGLKLLKTKLKFLANECMYNIYQPIYRIFADMDSRNLNYFSEKQTALIEKYWNLQAAKATDVWQGYVKYYTNQMDGVE